MNDTVTPSVLLPLATKLKECHSRDTRVTEKRVVEMWGTFKRISPEHGDTVSPAMLAGLILYDPEMFAPLLNGAEHAQLESLGRTALGRYQQLTNPPNKLGKTIAAALKEQI